jgi:DNA-binding CsgD family transcriptional regulator
MTPFRGLEPAQRAALLALGEELAQTGTWQLDLRTSEATWSDGLYRIHGLEPKQLEPGVDMLLARVHPADRGRLRALLDRVVRDAAGAVGDELAAEYRAVWPDDSIHDIRFRGYVQTDAGGVPVVWVGVAQDVSDQRLTERELQAHYAVSLALREWQGFDDGVVSLLRRLGTALEYPIGALWTWDVREQRVVARAFWSALDGDAAEFEAVTRDVALRPGQGVPGRVWETAEVIAIDRLGERLPPSRRKAARGIGLRSGLAFAAVAEDTPIAVLTFYAPDKRSAGRRLRQTVSAIGQQLGPFLLQRIRGLRSRRLTERELEVLRLAAAGKSGPRIAEVLFLSPATVKTHFEHIYEKLGVGDRAAAVAYALRTGLIQ